jgi:hypothetical protein
MPWRCPACQIAINHTAGDERPRPNVRYRCHICRLELVLERTTGRLSVAPADDDEDSAHERSTA